MRRLPIGPCSDLSTGQRESYEFWPWVLGTRSSCLRKGLGFWHLLQDQAWASGERDCQSHVGLQPETREGRRAEDRHTPLAISSWPWSCNPLQLMSCLHRSIPMQFSNRFGYVIVPSIQGASPENSEYSYALNNDKCRQKTDSGFPCLEEIKDI